VRNDGPRGLRPIPGAIPAQSRGEHREVRDGGVEALSSRHCGCAYGLVSAVPVSAAPLSMAPDSVRSGRVGTVAGTKPTA
jgi:hypothetical protein